VKRNIAQLPKPPIDLIVVIGRNATLNQGHPVCICTYQGTGRPDYRPALLIPQHTSWYPEKKRPGKSLKRELNG
ncbi:MAG: hypothetical protein LUQ05_02220, partial [Methanoregula sp.]|nr:hypothetical protein [Methanoregula sp.]